MNQPFFETQIARLEDQWRAAYGAERKAILWRCFRHVQDEEFQEAVSECLATMRSFPLLKELNEAVSIARTRTAERRTQAAADRMLASSNLADFAEGTKRESTREFARFCVELYGKRQTMSAAQWEQALGMLSTTAKTISGKCSVCLNGYVVLRDEVDGYEKFYRCTCSVGRATPPEVVGVAKDGERGVWKIPLAKF